MNVPVLARGATCLVLALNVGCTSAPLPAEPGLHEGIPPRELHREFMLYRRMSTDVPSIAARVSYHTEEQTVRFRWVGEGGLTAHPGLWVEDCSFWPTEVCPFGPNRLLVAGKQPETGATVVELWELESPTVSGIARSCRPSRRVIYEDRAAGRDMIRLLMRNEVAGTVLAQFWDSDDVCEIDPYTGAASLVLSRTEPVGELPAVAELGQGFDFCQSCRHREYGYLYALTFHESYDPTVASVYLADGNGDGTIDTVYLVDAERWDSMGLSDSDRYLEYFN